MYGLRIFYVFHLTIDIERKMSNTQCYIQPSLVVRDLEMVKNKSIGKVGEACKGFSRLLWSCCVALTLGPY